MWLHLGEVKAGFLKWRDGFFYTFSTSLPSSNQIAVHHKCFLACLKARFFLYQITSLPQSAYILQGVKHMYPEWGNLWTPNSHKHGECLQVPIGGVRPLQLKLIHPLPLVWWIHHAVKAALYGSHSDLSAWNVNVCQSSQLGEQPHWQVYQT